MNALVAQTINLPDTLEELSKFVLVGREKLNSVKAEIRAIDKLELAQEVRDQKREEAQMISEAILDAEVRLGELFKDIPQKKGGDRRSENFKSNSGVTSEKNNKPKSKEEILNGLGFSKIQANRLEKLADNADIVEFVKAEARENDEIATRARVFELVKNPGYDGENDNSCTETSFSDVTDHQKNELAEYDAFIDLRVRTYKDFMKIIELISNFDTAEHKMNALRSNFDHILTVDDHAEYITESIYKLNLIKAEIYKGRKR